VVHDEAFMEKLIETFRFEAEGHLKAITEGLLDMEKGVDAAETEVIIESVYRATHSLKGASRAVNMPEVEHLCQAMETLFASLKTNSVTPSQFMYDELHDAVNEITRYIFTPGKKDAQGLSSLIKRVEMLLTGRFPSKDSVDREACREISSPLSRDEEAGEEIAPGDLSSGEELSEQKSDAVALPIMTSASHTVRISVNNLNAVRSRIEEMIALKRSLEERYEEIRSAVDLLNTVKLRWSKAIQLLKHGENLPFSDRTSKSDMAEYFDYLYTTIRNVDKKLRDTESRIFHDKHIAGVTIDTLLEDVKKTLLLSFSSLLETFPKVVHDLARDNGRRAELHLSGTEIEIDRRILEEMRVPFMHLIRNSIDHGIETPETRVSGGKSPVGSISITINRIAGGKAEVLFSDDGNGIDEKKVQLAARKAGHITAGKKENITTEDVSSLIFLSGISTSTFITDLSGRGLGLAIVREKIEKLGGSIDIVDAQQSMGTTFRIIIPLTHATFRGVRVRVSDYEFILPTVAVERVLLIDEKKLFSVKGTRTIRYGESSVQLVTLAEFFCLPQKKDEEPASTVLLLYSGGVRIAVAVHEILSEEEVLVRSFSRHLASVQYFNGAAVLGSGKVVPVISVSAILKGTSMQQRISPTRGVQKEVDHTEPKFILVVEDSITSRILLKNILESAGYRVRTANDGIDGFAKLLEQPVDLIMSDVDMPRMSGFELTAKIKSDRRYSALPVVLVTALESPEDKKRGIDVGADAYIVKSSFDQSNLLEVVKRLL
jgi:two-component system chemotaxis sensor kinase CheA